MKFGKLFNFLIALILVFRLSAQDNLVEQIMINSKKFDKILADQSKNQLQIIYTQIDRSKRNKPRFKSFYFNHDPQRYFYPASTVKLATVVTAIEKINDLKVKGFTKFSKMTTGAEFEKHTAVTTDSSAQNFEPSVAHYSKKILLVSDNDAYNRLYEFVGQDELNQRLKKRGISNTKIFHRLEVGMTVEQNKRTNPVQFYNENNQLVYERKMVVSTGKYVAEPPITMGKGYQKGDKIINEPFDFSAKNFFPIKDQQKLLKAILFPESIKKSERFNLTAEDYIFIKQYMSQLPSETNYPKYDSPDYYDSYCKFIMFGDNKLPMPKNIRIFNKVGDAYGFLLDNAYFVDYESGIEFMVSAVILCNEDEIFNDGKYEYDEVGLPFYANLGKALYDFETTRKKKRKPDLNSMKMKYEVKK